MCTAKIKINIEEIMSLLKLSLGRQNSSQDRIRSERKKNNKVSKETFLYCYYSHAIVIFIGKGACRNL